jgi:phage-related protein
MPHSRAMPSVGVHCHELRVQNVDATWRIMYRIDADAIVILEVFDKKTSQTPKHVIDICKQRLRDYDVVTGRGKKR